MKIPILVFSLIFLIGCIGTPSEPSQNISNQTPQQIIPKEKAICKYPNALEGDRICYSLDENHTEEKYLWECTSTDWKLVQECVICDESDFHKAKCT